MRAAVKKKPDAGEHDAGQERNVSVDSTAPLAVGQQGLTLAMLTTRINEEHAACEKAMNAGLQHALECGRLLVEAKRQCEHGEWLPWIKENCEFSKRTAQAYMRVATQYPRLNGNAQHVARLTFRGAVAALASNSTTLANAPEEVRAEALNVWEDKNCKNSHQAIHQAEMAIRCRASDAGAVSAPTALEHRESKVATAAAFREDREPWADDPVGRVVDQFIGSCHDLMEQVEQETGGIPEGHPAYFELELIRDALSGLSEWLDHIDDDEQERAKDCKPGEKRGVDVIRANEAINCLTLIPKNDLLRKRGFQIVMDWIRHNRNR